MKKLSLPFIAFLQATGLALYIMLVATFFNFLQMRFPHDIGTFYAPLIMLLTLVISATTSGLLVLGRSAVYFWEKNYKACFALLGYTIGWCVFYLAMFITIISV